MQKVVLLIIFATMKTGANREFCADFIVLHTNKTHQVVGRDGVVNNRAYRSIAKLLASIAQAVREDKKVWVALIFTQRPNRAVGEPIS